MKLILLILLLICTIKSVYQNKISHNSYGIVYLFSEIIMEIIIYLLMIDSTTLYIFECQYATCELYDSHYYKPQLHIFPFDRGHW